jgi:hypothetical protein
MTMTPRKLVTLSLAGLVALAGTMAVVATTTLASAAVSTNSGLPWVHGAYLDHNPGNIALFQADTGKQLDAVSGFALESDIKNISWQAPGAKPVTDLGGNLLLAVPLWQSNRSVTSTSSNTADFTALRNNLVAAGIANKTYIRLGWEMNIPFGYWTVTSSNRTAWVAAFKNAVNTLRANNSGIKIIFNPNEGQAQSPSISNIQQLALDLKDYWEVLGLDFYNWDGTMNTQAGFITRYQESYGPKSWAAWLSINSLTKGFAFPEWGATATNGQSDNTVYMQQMVNLFSKISQGQTVDGTVFPAMQVIESYFNEPGFDYTPTWGGTITRYRLNTDSQTGAPRAAQLPGAGAAYKAALAAVVVQPTATPSVSSSPTAEPSPSQSGC